jgi:lysine 2,3-aminomutase
LVSQGQDKVVLRNFEGYITTYSEPTDYKRPKKTKWIPEPLEEPGQSGVAGLLRGEQMVIRPEGWHDAHMRGQELDITSEDLEEIRDVEVAKDKKAAKWKQVN